MPATTPRMTPADPADRQAATTPDPVSFEGRDGILGTRGLEPATRARPQKGRLQRGDEPLVRLHPQDEEMPHVDTEVGASAFQIPDS